MFNFGTKPLHSWRSSWSIFLFVIIVYICSTWSIYTPPIGSNPNQKCRSARLCTRYVGCSKTNDRGRRPLYFVLCHTSFSFERNTFRRCQVHSIRSVNRIPVRDISCGKRRLAVVAIGESCWWYPRRNNRSIRFQPGRCYHIRNEESKIRRWPYYDVPKIGINGRYQGTV